jgi:hypothetical protein
MRILAIILGVALVSTVMLSAVKTVILPRNAQTAITRRLFRSVFGVLRRVAHFSPSSSQESVLALVAPIGLILLPMVWVFLIMHGFALMFWGSSTIDFSSAVALSGSSITTLGFIPAIGEVHQALSFIEAIIGLVIIALLITFLPSLYTAFVQRETAVTKLEVRAGNPPSAVEFLIRHSRIGWLDNMDPYWLAWEQWFAEIEESHTTFPMLTLFRSPSPDRSWITAAGTVLDAASLTQAALPEHSSGASAVSIRAGFFALRAIARIFRIEFDPDPSPDDPIAVSRSEFDAALTALQEAGLPITDDWDQAWTDFAGWRVNYDTVLLTLAEITAAPAAPWVSDRSAPSHKSPFLKKRKKAKGRAPS